MWDRRRATRKQKRRQVIGWILMRVQVFIQLEETRLLLIIRRCSHASYSTNPADSFQLGLLDLHLQVDLCFLVDSSSNSRNMMPKQDLEATEDQISTIQVSSHGETVNPVLPHGRFKTVEKGRNWGWLLSGFIAINILLLGIAIVSGSVFNKIQITSSHLLIFLILLVILTTVWMIYYKIHTSRVYRAVLYKDSHAGPIWLRGESSFV